MKRRRTMFCDKCGKEIPKDLMFCPSCGKSVPSPEKEEKEKSFDLPPVPPSFNRPIPIANLPHSKRQKKLYGYGVTQKNESSKGTGCLVLALIFLFLSIAFVSGLFITDKIKEKSITESTTSSESTSVCESTSEKSAASSSTSAETTTKKRPKRKRTAKKKQPKLLPKKKQQKSPLKKRKRIEAVQ